LINSFINTKAVKKLQDLIAIPNVNPMEEFLGIKSYASPKVFKSGKNKYLKFHGNL